MARPLLSALLLASALQAQEAPPASADAGLLPPGLWVFTTGYVSPFRGAAAGSPGPTGSGNQSYQGTVGWGVSERVSLHLGVEVNDDPTYAPVRGERRDRSFATAALAGHTTLWSRPTSFAPRVSIGLQASAQIVWQASDPGLFNGGPVRDRRTFGAFALALPLALDWDDRASVSLAPSVATLPSRLMGEPYYGSMVRLALAGHVRPRPGWTVFAGGELPLGPGHNVVDGEGRLRRTATWRAGLGWRATGRVALRGYLTNASGVTPVTRHLTLPSDPRVLYGVGITYTPSVAEPAPSPRRAEAPTHGTSGPAMPPLVALAPGRGRGETALDSRGGWGVHLKHALGRRFHVELLATRLLGADAPAIMEADLGSGWEYRFAAELTLADPAEGAHLSWSHRVSVGRDQDDQQGYLLAEIVAGRQVGRRVTLLLNPLAIQSGGRSPVSVGVGAHVGLGPLTLAPAWRGSFTGERPVWNLALGVPLEGVGLPALDATLYLSNAAGPRELGRVLADPGGFRVGFVLGAGFGR